MTKFNPESAIVVNITGPEVTALKKNGTYLCRNKSFFKKVPEANTSEEDEEMHMDDSSSTNHQEPLRASTIPTAANSSESIPQSVIRRSSRARKPPQWYGVPIPSEIIEILKKGKKGVI